MRASDSGLGISPSDELPQQAMLPLPTGYESLISYYII